MSSTRSLQTEHYTDIPQSSEKQCLRCLGELSSSWWDSITILMEFDGSTGRVLVEKKDCKNLISYNGLVLS